MNTKKISCLYVFVVRISVTSLLAIPYFTDFSEGFELGSFSGQDGWQVISGCSDVVHDETARGGQAIFVYGTEPPSAVQRGFTWPSVENEIYIDFFIKPVAGEHLNNSTRIAASMASLAFIRTDNKTATLVARDGSSWKWQDTFLSVPIDYMGRALRVYRITIRLDRAFEQAVGEALYDVYVDGVLIDHDVGFRFNSSSEEFEFRILGAGRETWFDDFYVGPKNPLFEDAGTGIPVEWLSRHDLNLKSASRYAELMDGRLAIETFLEEQRPEYEAMPNFTLIDEATDQTSKRKSLTVFTRLEKPSFGRGN